MKIIFPFSILGSLNPRIDRNECLRVTEINIKYSKHAHKRYKLIKFQAIKLNSEGSIEIEHDLFGFKIIWEENNIEKPKKSKPFFYNDYDYYEIPGIILKETWLYQVIGISKFTNKIRVFNIAITDMLAAKNIVEKHLYYLGYNTIQNDNTITNYQPYNPNDFSWADEFLKNGID